MTVEGHTFRYVSEAARYFKVDPARVRGLIARRGTSVEEAIGIERAGSAPSATAGLSR